MQSLIILSSRTIGYFPPKKGKCELLIFHGNVEWVISIYDAEAKMKWWW